MTLSADHRPAETIGPKLATTVAAPFSSSHWRCSRTFAKLRHLPRRGPMQFKPHTFSHNERPDWYLHTHLRLTGRSGDTQDGIDMVKHIASVAQKKNRSVLSVIEVMRDFPARQPHRGFPDAILSDLRA